MFDVLDLIVKQIFPHSILHVPRVNIFLHFIDVGLGLGTFLHQWNANICNTRNGLKCTSLFFLLLLSYFCNVRSMLRGVPPGLRKIRAS